MEKALFLDRDGVINEDLGYVWRVDDFHFIDGIFELCRAAKDMGFLRIVVTNQAGIARGYYDESQFHNLSKRRGISTSTCPRRP
jgi:D-glycero-D-manno-heptose 1,7-bisphosphate phosphatase